MQTFVFGYLIMGNCCPVVMPMNTDADEGVTRSAAAAAAA